MTLPVRRVSVGRLVGLYIIFSNFTSHAPFGTLVFSVNQVRQSLTTLENWPYNKKFLMMNIYWKCITSQRADMTVICLDNWQDGLYVIISSPIAVLSHRPMPSLLCHVRPSHPSIMSVRHVCHSGPSVCPSRPSVTPKKFENLHYSFAIVCTPILCAN